MRRRSPDFNSLCHGPANAGLPEAVDAGGDDGFAARRDSQSRRRAVQMGGKNGLEREHTG